MDGLYFTCKIVDELMENVLLFVHCEQHMICMCNNNIDRHMTNNNGLA